MTKYTDRTCCACKRTFRGTTGDNYCPECRRSGYARRVRRAGTLAPLFRDEKQWRSLGNGGRQRVAHLG